MNALGDHHALGIIDNFATIIKTTLTAMFFFGGIIIQDG
jgi:hypothetical protein